MSIKPLSEDNKELFTLLTSAKRKFSSSSLGITGSVRVLPRISHTEKDLDIVSSFIDSTRSSMSLESTLRNIVNKAHSTGVTNIKSGMVNYLDQVNAIPESLRHAVDIEIARYEPTNEVTRTTSAKLFVQNILMPTYKTVAGQGMSWATTNYNSLCFFTSSKVPSNTAILYPNDSSGSYGGYVSGSYTPTGSFTMEFSINPRFTTDARDKDFKAGTILHLSSTFAISMVTGSSLGEDGKPDGFRLLLQLSSSANVKPSLALPGTAPNQYTFLSRDNVMQRNRWHRVVMRWGTQQYNAGTGSMYVDGINVGDFVFPYDSIAPTNIVGNPDVLVMGNYYEGTNNGTNALSRFFAADPAEREGLTELDSTTGVDAPGAFTLAHPFRGELHDVIIKNKIESEAYVRSTSDPVLKAPANLENVLFYVPPFFTTKSPNRKSVNGTGGILQTPFFAEDGRTHDPFNTSLSFGCDGYYVNLENYGRDFATGRFPRWLHLTASEIATTTDPRVCEEFLYDNTGVAKRNLTVLPCDDGKWQPNFELIAGYDEESPGKHSDGDGFCNPSLINLNNMVSGAFLEHLTETTSGSLFNLSVGPSPENLSEVSRGQLAVYQRTRDPSSNEIVLFDISNIYYGTRIKPGTVKIRDLNLTGSGGVVSISFADDGIGNLYRADAESPIASWNNQGNIFYDEGILLIKAPTIPHFGKNGFEIEFEGEKPIYVSKWNLLADAGEFNSSSNPSWKGPGDIGGNTTIDPGGVYITGAYLLDANLNILAKSTLAQPIIKRSNNRIAFRIRYDF